jgi:hypothetical protein
MSIWDSIIGTTKTIGNGTPLAQAVGRVSSTIGGIGDNIFDNRTGTVA